MTTTTIDAPEADATAEALEVRGILAMRVVLHGVGCKAADAAAAAGDPAMAFGDGAGLPAGVTPVTGLARYSAGAGDDVYLQDGRRIVADPDTPLVAGDDYAIPVPGGHVEVDMCAETSEMLDAAAWLLEEARAARKAAKLADKAAQRRLVRARSAVGRTAKAHRAAKADPVVADEMRRLRRRLGDARRARRDTAPILAAMAGLDGAAALAEAHSRLADAEQSSADAGTQLAGAERALRLARRADTAATAIAASGRRWATPDEHRAFFARVDHLLEALHL